MAAALGYLRFLGKQAQIRIIRSNTGSGVLMAVDAAGLRQLNELYALPKTCTEANAQASNVLALIGLCYPIPSPITSQMIKKGVALIPEGTRATYMGRS